MDRNLAAATLLSALLGGSALAQDTAETEPQASEAPVEETSTDAPPAETQAAAPEITTETFGDWEVRCEVTQGNCFMYQLATDPQGNPVIEMNIVALPEGADAAAGVTAVTPLGTLLPQGVVVQVDSNPARQYAYNWCDRSGCFARFGFIDDEIAQMKRGAKARVRIVSVSAPDQQVILEMSLTGFTAAFDRLSAPAE